MRSREDLLLSVVQGDECCHFVIKQSINFYVLLIHDLFAVSPQFWLLPRCFRLSINLSLAGPLCKKDSFLVLKISKVDKVSILDHIEYLKELKRKVEELESYKG
ncbi:basic helix-loop-helix (bHLH) DNA-bindingsuperfamily protein, partial [Striga asiatica]